MTFLNLHYSTFACPVGKYDLIGVPSCHPPFPSKTAHFSGVMLQKGIVMLQNRNGIHQNRISIHQNRISTHQNRISTQQNRISTHQNRNSTHQYRIVLPASPVSAYKKAIIILR